MDVEVKYRHAVVSRCARLQRGDGDGIEIAKSHRAFLRRVVARRTHKAERGLPRSGGGQGLQRAPSRPPRVRRDVRVGRSVAVEIERLLQLSYVRLGVS